MISGSGLLGDFFPNFDQISLPPDVGPFNDRITRIGRNKFPTPESGHAAQNIKRQKSEITIRWSFTRFDRFKSGNHKKDSAKRFNVEYLPVGVPLFARLDLCHRINNQVTGFGAPIEEFLYPAVLSSPPSTGLHGVKIFVDPWFGQFDQRQFPARKLTEILQSLGVRIDRAPVSILSLLSFNERFASGLKINPFL